MAFIDMFLYFFRNFVTYLGKKGLIKNKNNKIINI